MSSKDTLHKATYRRLTPDEWVEAEALYRAGVTAKVLAARFGTTERTIYSRARKYGWRRKDHAPTRPPMTPVEAEAAAHEMGAQRPGGAAPCRALRPDAPLGEAARAAAASAVVLLREGSPGAAQTYARVAGLLARLDGRLTTPGFGAGATERTILGAGAAALSDPEGTEAAMRFLAECLGLDVEAELEREAEADRGRAGGAR